MAATEFGHLLHRWRDRLDPRDAGFTSGTRRRAPGLRREELAQLAALSVDYIVRLEHGRATNPSAQVVAVLARALQLSRGERDELFVAAGLLPPLDGTVSTHVPAGVQRLVGRLGEAAIGVFAADWTLLTWSPAWASLHGDPTELPEAERNLARAVFGTGAARRALRPGHASPDTTFERSIVADLRRAAIRYPNDIRLSALLRDLREQSPRFAEYLDDESPAEHTSSTKTLHHPLVGAVTVDCDVLTVPGADLRVVTYTAPGGSEDANKLEVMRVGGSAASSPGAADG